MNDQIQESSKEVSKMLHEIDDKIKKIEEEISSTSETLKKAEEDRTVLQNEIDENRKRIDQVNTDISNTMTDLEEKQRQQEKKFKKTIQESSKEVSKIWHEMDDKIKKIEREISSTSETLKKAEEDRTVLQNKIDENRERIDQVNTDISNTRTDLGEKLRQQEKKMKKTIQESSKEVSKIWHELDDKIKKIEGELSSTSETIKKAEEARTVLQNKVNNIDEIVDKLEDIVNFLRANAFNKSVMMNLVVFLTTAVFALIIGMLIIWNRVSFDHHGNTPRHGSGTNRRMSVIEQVPNHPPLTNTICVISYGQTNESFNHTLVHKLMRQLSQPLQDTPVRGHLINTHADIANIPRCKLIFMCVEFSTRHVIIEEPGIGQGDIRRTTYDAVGKLGATLVILYTRDPESRQLGDKLRYQKDIYCVASQHELKVLDDQKCFYSVFTSFTQSQVESLETVIRKALQ